MGFEVVVSLLWSLRFLGLTAHNNRKHRRYKESVSEALTRGEIAKEAVEDLSVEITALNEKLSASLAREEGLKATLNVKETEHAAKIALLEDAKKVLKLEFEKAAQTLVSQGEKTLASRNQESLDQLLKPLSEKIDGFQSRVNQVHTDLTGQTRCSKPRSNSYTIWVK